MSREFLEASQQKSPAGKIAAVIIAGGVAYGVYRAASAPSPTVSTISLDESPYTMNLKQQIDLPYTVAYLKRVVVALGQWGPYGANVDTPPSPVQFRSNWLFNGAAPVKCGAGGWNCTPGGINFKPAQVDMVKPNTWPPPCGGSTGKVCEQPCDQYQSGVQIAAMAGATKDWVVVTGTPSSPSNNGCWASGTGNYSPQAFVYSLSQTAGFSFVSSPFDPTFLLIDQNQADPTIDGDTLYVRQRSPHHDLFSSWNLNTGALIASGLSSRPIWAPQPDIDGHLWNRVVVVYAQKYNLVQAGGGAITPTPTVPAVFTPTPAGTPAPTRTCPVCPICPPTPSRTPTRLTPTGVPCGGLLTCPTKTLTPGIGPHFTPTP